MQLRHIRPGSLEWHDAQTDEVGQMFERLTPEEIEHLRKTSEGRRLQAKQRKTRTEVHQNV